MDITFAPYSDDYRGIVGLAHLARPNCGVEKVELEIWRVNLCAARHRALSASSPIAATPETL